MQYKFIIANYMIKVYSRKGDYATIGQYLSKYDHLYKEEYPSG